MAVKISKCCPAGQAKVVDSWTCPSMGCSTLFPRGSNRFEEKIPEIPGTQASAKMVCG